MTSNVIDFEEINFILDPNEDNLVKKNDRIYDIRLLTGIQIDKRKVEVCFWKAWRIRTKMV